jgi:hypothetical protein
MYSKAMASVRALEITASDERGLTVQAGRLLECVSAEPTFIVPSFIVATSVASAVCAPQPVLRGPYLFRGMDEREIEAELTRIRTADPTLDSTGAIKELARLHPELFTPPPSDFEFSQQNLRTDGMIGTTSVPDEPVEERHPGRPTLRQQWPAVRSGRLYYRWSLRQHARRFGEVFDEVLRRQLLR